MSVANYGELKTAIANWTARSDLTDRIPEFIDSGLQRINNDLMLRGGIPDQEQIATAVTVKDQESYSLPTNFRTMRWLKRDYSSASDLLTLESRSYADIVNRYGTQTGAPECFCVMDGSFYLGPIPDAVYTLRLNYIKKYLALSADADTNYLFTDGNNILLWASLIEAFAFTADMQRSQDAVVAYRESLESLRLVARKLRQPRVPLQSDVLLLDTCGGDIFTGQ
jgi:hypothetical protein